MSILDDAVQLLGTPVKIDNRGWATWWCPFHDDQARYGAHGNPNFGINLEQGFWKCLRCGQHGSSLAALEHKLGEWRPVLSRVTMTRQPSNPQVNRLGEALAEARAAFADSPAFRYVVSRGVKSRTALQYGLGYGITHPSVRLETIRAARYSRLVSHDGTWLWAGGVVYAEPPISPTTIQVRHLRQGVDRKYQTWGRLLQPLGAWRLTATTSTVVVVEGMLDMLVLAQALRERELEDTQVVYTAGSSPSRAMLDWFAASPYDYVLIPDRDEAGISWTQALIPAIQHGGGAVIVAETPDALDPDQAVLKGWWPKGL